MVKDMVAPGGQLRIKERKRPMSVKRAEMSMARIIVEERWRVKEPAMAAGRQSMAMTKMAPIT